MSNLLERSLTSVLFVLVLVGSIIQSEFASSILFFAIILLCQKEFYAFFKPTNIKPQKNVGIIGGLLFFLLSVFTARGDLVGQPLVFIIPLIFSIFVIELYRNRPRPIPNIAFTILGIIYIAVPMALLHQLSYFNGLDFEEVYNYDLLLGYFFILWANDTGAFLVGRKIGKTKLFPRISPKKTWEGTIGGAVFGILTAFINSLIFPEINSWLWIGIGVIIVIFGSLGDLVESLFKRSLDIKDSGKLLPGHGGVLDRFDGIFISAPMVYFFLKIISIV